MKLSGGHNKEICSLKWNLDFKYLASGGNDNLVCLWDVRGKFQNNNSIWDFLNSQSDEENDIDNDNDNENIDMNDKMEEEISENDYNNKSSINDIINNNSGFLSKKLNLNYIKNNCLKNCDKTNKYKKI